MKPQQGVALIIVLWMLVLFMLMAFSYSNMMRTETKLTASIVHQTKAKAIAEAGIWTGVNELLRPQIEKTWLLDGTIQNIPFHNSIITVALEDQAGKIDINTASSDLLASLLIKTDMPEEDRSKILHSILDWRDRDDLNRLYGAEDQDYQSAGLPYSVKNGSFNHINELLRVMGMTPEIYKQLKPAITIHSHQTGIYLKNAPKETLLMLPGINSDNIDDLLDAQKRGNVNELISLYGLNNKHFIQARGHIYNISSTGTYNGHIVDLDAVILITRNREKPYTILSWTWSDN